jgi:hypothetical protein
MGPASPERFEQVKQIKPSQLRSEIRNYLEWATTTNKPRNKDKCKPGTTATESVKSRALYKLCKININLGFNNLCHDIFRYGVS